MHPKNVPKSTAPEHLRFWSVDLLKQNFFVVPADLQNEISSSQGNEGIEILFN
jgi:hypothetical protein